ncbi:hypothetical protein LTR62_007970 [Meristemomyces frigidus]|uniref:SWR1-complex protein 5 n=1 Tax=Meristemomyces frigidus TaxID=1508187 RepID=A0AAN7YIZ9_9PEZI|nr:hypothetical protein LTR62_007970 [Meristemomyces frigidus]
MVINPVAEHRNGESDSEEYDENADEDFNPDEAAAEAVDSSSDDEDQEAIAKPIAKQTNKRKADTLDDTLDSGDEATIKERRVRKRRKKDAPQHQQQQHEDDSGGEGSFIRTRAQRTAEKAERKEKKGARVGEITIDVDAIWEELKRVPLGRAPEVQKPPTSQPSKRQDAAIEDNKGHIEHVQDNELITIKRRINYAGETTEITERVPLSSKAAQTYIKDHPPLGTTATPTYVPLIHRPLRRPSPFEPNPTATIKGVPPTHPLLRPHTPSRADTLLLTQRLAEETKKKAEKMTTVQKSALDWRGFVQTEGIGEELEEYGRGKKGFLAREEFLGKVELGVERRGREARLKVG